MKTDYEFVISKRPYFDSFRNYNILWKTSREEVSTDVGKEIAYVSEKIVSILKKNTDQKKIAVIKTCKKQLKKPDRYESMKEPISKDEINALKRLLEKKKNGSIDFVYLFPE